MLKPFIAAILLITGMFVFAAEPPLTAARYAQLLGTGMDVDWALTDRGIREFDPLVVRDFHSMGITHVRINVAGKPTEARLIHLRKLVDACEKYGVIPIISYQQDRYKNNPQSEVVNWWVAVAHYFGQSNPLLGFDLINEPTDKINHNAALLNHVYRKTIRAIHIINPRRMIFIAPLMYAAPEDLTSLKFPAHSQNYLLAEWHMFSWGPLKNNGKYPWTSGTAAEKAAIRTRINTVVHWQKTTGHSTWVGGWGAGESRNNTPTAAQIAFATFMACELKKAKIAYAINSNTQFYDGEEGNWRPEQKFLLKAMLTPACGHSRKVSGQYAVRSSAGGAS